MPIQHLSCSSAESGDAPAPADKKESSGLMGVFGAMAAVMVVVVAFYSVRSLCTTAHCMWYILARCFVCAHIQELMFAEVAKGRSAFEVTTLRSCADVTPPFLVQVAFVAGGAMLLQFKDQIGSVTKKDFVPYSERRAMEQQLLQERMDVRAFSPCQMFADPTVCVCDAYQCFGGTHVAKRPSIMFLRFPDCNFMYNCLQ